MKIEVGESLIYSYLRHVKSCLITQTNWKPSGEWEVPSDVEEEVLTVFNKINKHSSFSGIFPSNLSQTIKQAELDVIGVDRHGHVYAFEVAFHENGLQYGGKVGTRNRVIKKLLRGYLTLKLYFPDHFYSIAFCSPKVNPATERHIKEYLEILTRDFQEQDVAFQYFSNEEFNAEIVQHTLSKTCGEADSSELFSRSIKLLNIAEKATSKEVNSNLHNAEVLLKEENDSPKEAIQNIVIQGVSIPVKKVANETVQDYIRKIMRLLLNGKLLSKQELEHLQDKEQCRKMFFLQFPLLRNVSKGYRDDNGRGRYWAREIFGDEYYVCSQWWKEHENIYLEKIERWLLSLSKP